MYITLNNCTRLSFATTSNDAIAITSITANQIQFGINGAEHSIA